MKNFYFIFLIIIPVIAFGQKATLPLIKNNFTENPQFKKSNNSEMWERNVQYLGPYIDTIHITKIEDLRTPIGNNTILIDDNIEKKYASYLNNELEISLDTKEYTTLEQFQWWTKKRISKYYKAYSIIISNNTDSTTIVGYGHNIPIILEALNEEKKWIPIEVPYMYQCGTGMEYILLKPNNILCVLAPIYKGNFKTKLRYRLGNNFSEEFIGSISKKQFIVNRKTYRM